MVHSIFRLTIGILLALGSSLYFTFFGNHYDKSLDLLFILILCLSVFLVSTVVVDVIKGENLFK